MIALTVTTSNITSIAEEIEVSETVYFPEYGFIFIDGEIIKYDAKTSDGFIECTRGYLDTKPDEHASGSLVMTTSSLTSLFEYIDKELKKTILKSDLDLVYSNINKKINAALDDVNEKTQSIENTMEVVNSIRTRLKHSHIHIVGEKISGTFNGSNQSYETAENYVQGTLAIYLNGFRKSPDEFEETGDNSFNLSAAPMPGADLIVDYQRSLV